MPQDDIPPDDMTSAELLREIAGNLRYLRRVLSEFEPLLAVVRGNAVRGAGLRRSLKNGARNAATPAR